MMYGMKKTRLEMFYQTNSSVKISSSAEKKTHVSKASKLKFGTHTSNVGSTHVGAIHERDTVHGTDGNYQTTINALDDAALLLLGEAMVGIDLGANLAGRLVDMLEVGVGLLLNSVHVVWPIHGCQLLRECEYGMVM
jgi:hypothetical protein